MPNKKSKSNVPKGKAQAPSSSEAQQAPSSAGRNDALPNALLPPPNPTEDFWAKNARAKALIMSTLVPGSEPWKIAEPLELASDIWKALEDKYAPKDRKTKGSGDSSKAGNSTGTGADKSDEHSSGTKSPASDFIGDWVEGKPMDKYLEMYKDRLAKAQSAIARANAKDAETKPMAPPSNVSALAEQVRKELEAADLAGAAQASRQSQPPPASSAAAAISYRWRATPVKHDSYLSEGQALAFAQNDVERKKQIQAAATKVLMQKLPTRDLRLLWAVLYGGVSAPWPGSFSPVIPGVTTTIWHDKTYEILQGTWNNNTDEIG